MQRHNSWCTAATKRAGEHERRTELLTPQCHKDGEEDGGRIVEQVAGPSCAASGDQFPVAADSVTNWAHGDIVSLVTDFHTEYTKNKPDFRNTSHLYVSLDTIMFPCKAIKAAKYFFPHNF